MLSENSCWLNLVRVLTVNEQSFTEERIDLLDDDNIFADVAD